MDSWKKQSEFRFIFKKVPKTKITLKMKLSLFETALRETCGYISFEVLLWVEHNTKATSYTHDNCKYLFQWNDMIGTLDDQEEDSEIERLLQLIEISAAAPIRSQ